VSMKMRGMGCCSGDIFDSISVVANPTIEVSTIQKSRETLGNAPVKPRAVVWKSPGRVIRHHRMISCGSSLDNCWFKNLRCAGVKMTSGRIALAGMDPYSESSDVTLSVLRTFSTPYPDEIDGGILISSLRQRRIWRRLMKDEQR
jgi:hypothetical protein